MRRGILIAIAMLTLALFGGGVARGERAQEDTLGLVFNAGFAPHALPRERAAPVTISLEGRIATNDGSTPPPLRRFRVELNRNGRLSTTGLPICRAAQLQSTTSARALSTCRGAQVGSGSFRADLPSSEAAIPSRGRIVVFNSRSHGRPSLLLHLYGTVPIQATFVLPLTIHRRRQGSFGTILAARVPRLAGGVGAITQLKLDLGRRYRYRGKLRSYLSASCAAPAGFSLAVFPFARASFHFVGGTNLETSLSRDCRVRR
jgi:hypothetical protein